MKSIHPTEAQEQMVVIEWANYNLGKYPELELLYHIANERKCNVITGAKLKKLGVKSGVPDLCLPVARGKFHGLYIELKAKNGKVSENQITWMNKLSQYRNYVRVSFGADDAINILEWYLKLSIHE
jgi:hypothetical protein